MKMRKTIPILPVQDIKQSVAFNTIKPGFTARLGLTSLPFMECIEISVTGFTSLQNENDEK
jgi:hypothetical protein